MTIILLLLGLGILWWVSNINSRLSALEAKLHPQPQVAVSDVRAEPVAIIPSEPTHSETPVISTSNERMPEVATSTPSSSGFENWLKTDWQIKLGALLLLISFGWFARYAFMNNWIGPVGRISLGIIAGMVIAAFGTLRLKTHRTQGEIFLVLGSSIVLVTVFAARYYYQMFSPLVALFAMFLASAYVAVISAKEKNALLAFSGLILGGLAPLFTVTSEPNALVLFTYLLAVTLGSIWLAYFHERRDIISAGLGVYAFYSLIHLDVSIFDRSNAMMLAFFFVFAALFAAANITNHIKTKSGEHFSDIMVALTNNALVLIWTMTLAPEPLKIGLLLAWAAIFAGCAFACRMFGNTKELWSIYYGSAITLLAIATAEQFGGNTLIVAFTLEALAIIAATHAIKKDFVLTKRMAWLLLLPILMSAETIFSPLWVKSEMMSLIGTLGLIATACFGLGLYFAFISDQTKEASKTITTLNVLASAYIYIILWRVTHVWLSSDIATMVSLLTYTVIGLTTNLYGQLHKLRTLRLYGGIILGLVVARLLFVDVWEMAIPGRIVTFFLIGTLLMSTAFIGRSGAKFIKEA